MFCIYIKIWQKNIHIANNNFFDRDNFLSRLGYRPKNENIPSLLQLPLTLI